MLMRKYLFALLVICSTFIATHQGNYSGGDSGAGVDEDGDELVLVGTFSTVWYLLCFSPRELLQM